MKKRLVVVLSATTAFMLPAGSTLAATGTVQDAPAAQPPPPPPAIYDEAANGAEQIEEAVAKAKKENRRVLIQWGANWCGWCHLLHGVFASDAAVKRTLLYEYDVVLIDIGKWDKNLDLAAKYEADFKAHGVPYLTVLDGEGHVIANQETSSLEDGDHHDPAKVLAFLEKHQAAYLSAESLYNEGLARAKQEGKRAFVHFGAPWCGWCHKLEDWMAREDVAEILTKDFVDVKIDTERTIGGADLHKQMTENKPSGIPWFAFVDSEGEVVADSFALPDGGNLGFPYTDEEIAAFGEMLEKAAVHITPEEIEVLLKTLKEGRERG